MKDDDAPKPLNDLLHPGSTLMLSIDDGTPPLQFRPMTVARVSGSAIEMLLDTNEDWVQSLEHPRRAYVTLSDTRHNTWASLHGQASLSHDPGLIDELWSPAADAYFDNGRETPGIAVLRVDGEAGRYWSSPAGRIGALISMIKAKLGDPEESGEHGSIEI